MTMNYKLNYKIDSVQKDFILTNLDDYNKVTYEKILKLARYIGKKPVEMFEIIKKMKIEIIL